MQPVEDLTIEDRVSRNQYQLRRGMRIPRARRVGAPLVDRLAQLPQLVDVASDLQDQGLQAFLSIDRDTRGAWASRPGARPLGTSGSGAIMTFFQSQSASSEPEFRQGADATGRHVKMSAHSCEACQVPSRPRA